MGSVFCRKTHDKRKQFEKKLTFCFFKFVLRRRSYNANIPRDNISHPLNNTSSKKPTIVGFLLFKKF